jgi:hypothetical protein
MGDWASVDGPQQQGVPAPVEPPGALQNPVVGEEGLKRGGPPGRGSKGQHTADH